MARVRRYALVVATVRYRYLIVAQLPAILILGDAGVTILVPAVALEAARACKHSVDVSTIAVVQLQRERAVRAGWGPAGPLD